MDWGHIHWSPLCIPYQSIRGYSGICTLRCHRYCRYRCCSSGSPSDMESSLETWEYKYGNGRVVKLRIDVNIYALNTGICLQNGRMKYGNGTHQHHREHQHSHVYRYTPQVHCRILHHQLVTRNTHTVTDHSTSITSKWSVSHSRLTTSCPRLALVTIPPPPPVSTQALSRSVTVAPYHMTVISTHSWEEEGGKDFR